MHPASVSTGLKWRECAERFALSAKRPLIVIVGATASGKTGFSIELAKHLQFKGFVPEIINADSRQLYKFLDIGTAKITEEEKRGVPHHLLSVLDPKEEVSIAWFQREATAVINRLHSKQKIPILVGGSMLYVSSIVDGLEPLPSDPGIRERLSSEYDQDQGEILWKRLFDLDPEAAESIPRQNKIYLVRALELLEMTGKPRSERKKHALSAYDLLMFGIDRNPEDLKKRIDERINQMFQEGWIEEVQTLLEKRYSKDDPGMKSVGYGEIIEYLGSCPHLRLFPPVRLGRTAEGGEMTEAGLREKIASKTRSYAKRSRTWWRDDPRIIWLRLGG